MFTKINISEHPWVIYLYVSHSISDFPQHIYSLSRTVFTQFHLLEYRGWVGVVLYAIIEAQHATHSPGGKISTTLGILNEHLKYLLNTPLLLLQQIYSFLKGNT